MGRGATGARRSTPPWAITAASHRQAASGEPRGPHGCRQPPESGQKAGGTCWVWAAEITGLVGYVSRVRPILLPRADTLEKPRHSPLLLAGRGDLSLNQQMIKVEMYT